MSILGKEVSFPWWDESTARGKALVVGIMSSGVGDDNAAWILLFQTGEAKVYEYDEMNNVYPLDNQLQSDDMEYTVLYAPLFKPCRMLAKTGKRPAAHIRTPTTIKRHTSTASLNFRLTRPTF